jgi:hypothetical protein
VTYADIDLVLLVGVHVGDCRGLWCCGSQVTFFRGAAARERRRVVSRLCCVMDNTKKGQKVAICLKDGCRWLALTTLGEYRYPLCDRDRVDRRD